MEIHSNFEKYSPSRRSDLDQLVCLLKGSLDMIMINETFLNNVSFFNCFINNWWDLHAIFFEILSVSILEQTNIAFKST
jgi:hypothetical protein